MQILSQEGEKKMFLVLLAVLSVPGHFVFGVIMGHYYSLQKKADVWGDRANQKRFARWAVIVPMLCHGMYDFCLSTQELKFILIFLVFIIVVYVRVFKNLKRYAEQDMALDA